MRVVAVVTLDVDANTDAEAAGLAGIVLGDLDHRLELVGGNVQITGFEVIEVTVA
jgi:hypothetical protein